MQGKRKASDARVPCSHCRLAINKSVKQLTGDSGESGAEPMSILPTAQWTRAADLLRHAVEITEEEQSSTYICIECQVGAVSFWHPRCFACQRVYQTDVKGASQGLLAHLLASGSATKMVL